MKIILYDTKKRFDLLLPHAAVLPVWSAAEFLRALEESEGCGFDRGFLIHTSDEGAEIIANKLCIDKGLRALLFSDEPEDDPKSIAAGVNAQCGERRAWFCSTGEAVARLGIALGNGDTVHLYRSYRHERALALLSSWWQAGNPVLSSKERNDAVARAAGHAQEPSTWPESANYLDELRDIVQNGGDFCAWFVPLRDKVLRWAELEEEESEA